MASGHERPTSQLHPHRPRLRARHLAAPQHPMLDPNAPRDPVLTSQPRRRLSLDLLGHRQGADGGKFSFPYFPTAPKPPPVQALCSCYRAERETLCHANTIHRIGRTRIPRSKRAGKTSLRTRGISSDWGEHAGRFTACGSGSGVFDGVDGDSAARVED